MDGQVTHLASSFGTPDVHIGAVGRRQEADWVGTLFEYRCANCHYQAQVSGTYDRGFEQFQVTILCEVCQEVIDIVIDPSLWRDNCNGGLLVYPDVRCPAGSAHPCYTWDHLCPKCGEEMKREGLVIDWD